MQPRDGMCPMCEWMMGWGWGAMLIMAVLGLLAIGLIGWAVYRLGRHAARKE